VRFVEELVSLCELRDVFNGICVEAGLLEKDLEHVLEEAAQLVNYEAVAFRPMPIEEGMMGLKLEETDRCGRVDTATEYNGEDSRAQSSYPKRVDISNKFREVLDQGMRGTCVACAKIAVREYEERAQGREFELSPQYLYYRCKRVDGHDGPGTYPRVALEQLSEYGTCFEETWPYNPDPIPKNEGQGPPPAAAISEGRQYRIASFEAVGTSIEEVKERLSRPGWQAKPLTFSSAVFATWGSRKVREDGEIPMPFSGERIRGHHMLVVVGYADDDNAPGGGWILFRNSWGPEWASKSDVGPGNGKMPYAYWNRYVRGSYSMERRSCEAEVHRSSIQRPWTAAAIAIVLCLALLLGRYHWQEVGSKPQIEMDDTRTVQATAIEEHPESKDWTCIGEDLSREHPWNDKDAQWMTTIQNLLDHIIEQESGRTSANHYIP